MKIALTVKGVGLGAWLDEDFAQCGFVMIVADDDQFESWKNPASEGEDQSSQALLDLITQAKPDVLATGKISNSHKETLTAQGIKVLDNRQGFVLEMLEQVRG